MNRNYYYYKLIMYRIVICVFIITISILILSTCNQERSKKKRKVPDEFTIELGDLPRWLHRHAYNVSIKGQLKTETGGVPVIITYNRSMLPPDLYEYVYNEKFVMAPEPKSKADPRMENLTFEQARRIEFEELHGTERPFAWIKRGWNFTCDVCGMEFAVEGDHREHWQNHYVTNMSATPKINWTAYNIADREKKDKEERYWIDYYQKAERGEINPTEMQCSTIIYEPILPKGPPWKCLYCRINTTDFEYFKKHHQEHLDYEEFKLANLSFKFTRPLKSWADCNFRKLYVKDSLNTLEYSEYSEARRIIKNASHSLNTEEIMERTKNLSIHKRLLDFAIDSRGYTITWPRLKEMPPNDRNVTQDCLVLDDQYLYDPDLVDFNEKRRKKWEEEYLKKRRAQEKGNPAFDTYSQESNEINNETLQANVTRKRKKYTPRILYIRKKRSNTFSYSLLGKKKLRRVNSNVRKNKKFMYKLQLSKIVQKAREYMRKYNKTNYPTTQSIYEKVQIYKIKEKFKKLNWNLYGLDNYTVPANIDLAMISNTPHSTVRPLFYKRIEKRDLHKKEYFEYVRDKEHVNDLNGLIENVETFVKIIDQDGLAIEGSKNSRRNINLDNFNFKDLQNLLSESIRTEKKNKKSMKFQNRDTGIGKYKANKQNLNIENKIKYVFKRDLENSLKQLINNEHIQTHSNHIDNILDNHKFKRDVIQTDFFNNENKIKKIKSIKKVNDNKIEFDNDEHKRNKRAIDNKVIEEDLNFVKHTFSEIFIINEKRNKRNVECKYQRVNVDKSGNTLMKDHRKIIDNNFIQRKERSIEEVNKANEKIDTVITEIKSPLVVNGNHGKFNKIRNKRSINNFNYLERIHLRRMKREPRFRKDRLSTKKKKRTTCPFFARSREMWNCTLCDKFWSLEAELDLHNYKAHNGSPQIVSYSTREIESQYHTFEYFQIERNDTVETTREKWEKRCLAANQKRHRFINRGCTKRPLQQDGTDDTTVEPKRKKRDIQGINKIRRKREIRYEDSDGNRVSPPWSPSEEERMKVAYERKIRSKRDVIASDTSLELENEFLRKNRIDPMTFTNTKSWEWRIKNVNIRDYVYKILAKRMSTQTPQAQGFVLDRFDFTNERLDSKASRERRIAKFYEEHGPFSGKTGSDILDYFESNLHDRHMKEVIPERDFDEEYHYKPKEADFAKEHHVYSNVKPGYIRSTCPSHYPLAMVGFTDKKHYYDSSIEVAKSEFRLRRDLDHQLKDIELQKKLREERKRHLREHENKIRGKRNLNEPTSGQNKNNTGRTFWFEKWADQEVTGIYSMDSSSHTKSKSSRRNHRPRKRRCYESNSIDSNSRYQNFHVIDTHPHLFDKLYPNLSVYTPYTFYPTTEKWLTSNENATELTWVEKSYSDSMEPTESELDPLAKSCKESLLSNKISREMMKNTVDPEEYRQWCEWQRNRSLEDTLNTYTFPRYNCTHLGCTFNNSDEDDVFEHELHKHHNLPTDFMVRETVFVNLSTAGYERLTNIEYILNMYSDEKKHPEIRAEFEEFVEAFDKASFPTPDPKHTRPSKPKRTKYVSPTEQVDTEPYVPRKRSTTTRSPPATTATTTTTITATVKVITKPTTAATATTTELTTSHTSKKYSLKPAISSELYGSVSELTEKWDGKPTPYPHMDSNIKMEYSEETIPPKYRCLYCGDFFHEAHQLVHHKSSVHPRKRITPTTTPCIQRIKKYFTLDSEVDLSKNYDFVFSEPDPNETFVQKRPILEDSFYTSFDSKAPEHNVRNESYEAIEDYMHEVLNKSTWEICNACGKNISDDKAEAHFRKHVSNIKKDYFDELPPEYMDRCYKEAHWNKSWETIHHELKRKYEEQRLKDSDEFEVFKYKCKRCNETFTNHDKTYAHMLEHKKNMSRESARQAAIRTKIRQKQLKEAFDKEKTEQRKHEDKRERRSIDCIEIDLTNMKKNQSILYNIYEAVNNSNEKIVNLTPISVGNSYTISILRGEKIDENLNNEMTKNENIKEEKQNKIGIKDDYDNKSIDEMLESHVHSKYFENNPKDLKTYISTEEDIDYEVDKSNGIPLDDEPLDEQEDDLRYISNDETTDEDHVDISNEDGSIASDPDRRSDDINTIKNGEQYKKSNVDGQNPNFTSAENRLHLRNFRECMKIIDATETRSEQDYAVQYDSRLDYMKLRKAVDKGETSDKKGLSEYTDYEEIKSDRWKCFECNTTFDDYAAFLQHLKKEKEPKYPFLIDIEDKARRDTIERVFTKEDLFDNKCHECGQRFDTRKELIAHINSKDIESLPHVEKLTQSVVCRHCNVLYSNVPKYMIHRAAVKEAEDKFRNQTKKLLCGDCKKYFDTYDAYIEHLNEERKMDYEEMPKYRCNMCNFTYLDSNSLGLHKIKIHYNGTEPNMGRRKRECNRKNLQKVRFVEKHFSYNVMKHYFKVQNKKRRKRRNINNEKEKRIKKNKRGDVQKETHNNNKGGNENHKLNGRNMDDKFNENHIKFVNNKNERAFIENNRFKRQIPNDCRNNKLNEKDIQNVIHNNNKHGYENHKLNRRNMDDNFNENHRKFENSNYERAFSNVNNRFKRQISNDYKRNKRDVDELMDKIDKEREKYLMHKWNSDFNINNPLLLNDKYREHYFKALEEEEKFKALGNNNDNEKKEIEKDYHEQCIYGPGLLGTTFSYNLWPTIKYNILGPGKSYNRTEYFHKYYNNQTIKNKIKKIFKEYFIDKVNATWPVENFIEPERDSEELRSLERKEKRSVEHIVEKRYQIVGKDNNKLSDTFETINGRIKRHVIDRACAHDQLRDRVYIGKKIDQKCGCKHKFPTQDEDKSIKEKVYVIENKEKETVGQIDTIENEQKQQLEKCQCNHQRVKRGDDEYSQKVKIDINNNNTIQKVNWEKLAKVLVAENRNLSKLLEKHMTTKTTPIRLYECKVCGDRFPSLQPYIEHICMHEKEKELEKSYSEEFNITCDHCYQIFSTEDAIHEHNMERLRILREKEHEAYIKLNRSTRMKIMTPFENPFTIPIMENEDNTFWNPAAVEEPTETPDPRDKYFCYYCKDLMIDTKEFVEHNKFHEVSRKQAKEQYLKYREEKYEKFKKEFDVTGSLQL